MFILRSVILHNQGYFPYNVDICECEVAVWIEGKNPLCDPLFVIICNALRSICLLRRGPLFVEMEHLSWLLLRCTGNIGVGPRVKEGGRRLFEVVFVHSYG